MRRVWLLAFLGVLVAGQAAVGMAASRTSSVTGDEPFYLLTTQSLLSDGDLDLRDEYRNGEERRFWDASIPLWRQMEPAPDGRLLSPHDPGLSLLVLPAYAAGGLRGVQRFLVVVWAAAMACAAVLARRAGAPAWAAVVAAVGVGAGAPGLVYASQVYPEGPAALAVAGGLVVATGARPRPLLAAASTVALAWLGVKYVPLAAVVAGVWAWRFREQRRALATAALVVAAAAAHFSWWHLRTFGGLTPYTTNVVWAGDATRAILESHLGVADRTHRLAGLFVDARFGLFRWLPLAPLALWGVRRRTLAHAGVVAVAVVMGTFVSITMMGWWFPGRMLVAALPAAVVLVALGAARFPRLAACLAAWSLAIAGAVAWATHHGSARLAVDPWTIGFPLPPAWAFPDFRGIGARTVALCVAWGAALALAAVVVRRRAARAVLHDRPGGRQEPWPREPCTTSSPTPTAGRSSSRGPARPTSWSTTRTTPSPTPRSWPSRPRSGR